MAKVVHSVGPYPLISRRGGPPLSMSLIDSPGIEGFTANENIA